MLRQGLAPGEPIGAGLLQRPQQGGGAHSIGKDRAEGRAQQSFAQRQRSDEQGQDQHQGRVGDAERSLPALAVDAGAGGGQLRGTQRPSPFSAASFDSGRGAGLAALVRLGGWGCWRAGARPDLRLGPLGEGRGIRSLGLEAVYGDGHGSGR